MPYSLSTLEEQFRKIKAWLIAELGVLRTGRANPAMVKNVSVDYHGVKTNLENLASIRIQDAHTLVIQPWDKGTIEAIEHAIRSSSIGFQPITDKEVVRLILPELTGERREALLKIVGGKLEDARISLRKVRDEVWKDIQEQERAGTIREDEKFHLKEKLQKHIDEFNQEFEELVRRKQIEIRS